MFIVFLQSCHYLSRVATHFASWIALASPWLLPILREHVSFWAIATHFARWLFISSPWLFWILRACDYFFRISTHFCKLTFYCVALVVVKFTRMWLFLQACSKFRKVTFYGIALVAVNLTRMLLLPQDYHTLCELTFDCIALVVVSCPNWCKSYAFVLACINSHKPYAVLCSMPVDFRKLWLRPASILWSIRLCSTYVHGRHVECSGSSVIPGGVPTT